MIREVWIMGMNNKDYIDELKNQELDDVAGGKVDRIQ